MVALLLVIIYLAFISLGLPDSLLGSAWPLMYADFSVTLSHAGILSMIVAGGTILSSLFSNRLIQKLGTGPVTAVSVFLTANALLGVSFSRHYWVLCLWAVLLGLGAGSVDAALNNYVALRYKARHMNWLHCFWGIGASLGPVILSYFMLRSSETWRTGYRAIGIIQMVLTGILLLSLPLWKKAHGDPVHAAASERKTLRFRQLAVIPGARQTLFVFFCYCALEATVGLWGSSYLVVVQGVAPATAAKWIALYYFGITLGRFFSGLLVARFSDRQMILMGQTVIGCGVVLLLFSLALGLSRLSLVGLFAVGLGCAPIFPSLLHETPRHFGGDYSQAMMGIQMASAYVGTTFVPPLFGFLAAQISYRLFPFFSCLLLAIMMVLTRSLYRKTAENASVEG